MSYKTNLNTTVVDSTTQKEIPIERARLKAQLDDFATFQWRGHHMFDDFGCFIINEQKGSLKFYNGPSFTNQYAKTQFSSSTNALLGVDFKQQTIPMKVGLYWFTIEEYQEFLECIGPYQVNYITFDFDNEYGYLVKSGKIADSIKYVIGTDKNGQKRYYTEMDLTWEILGSPCVRSNLAYEYQATNTPSTNSCQWEIAKYPLDYSDESKRGKIKGDMSDNSLLDTPLVFEIPCYFTNSTASLKLEAILDIATITKTIIEAGKESTSSATLESQTITLFDLELQNLTAAIDAKSKYKLASAVVNSLESNESIYYCEQGVFDSKSAPVGINISNFTAGDYSEARLPYRITEDSSSFKIICLKHILTKVTITEDEAYTFSDNPNLEPEWGTIDFNKGEIIILKSSITVDLTITIEGKEFFDFNAESFKHKQFIVKYEQEVYDNIAYINSIDSASSNVVVYDSDSEKWSPLDFNEEEEVEIVCKKSGIASSLYSYLTWSAFVFEEDWGSSESLYQLYLRYDSETGLIYIQNGSQTSWHLLNYQTDNTNGELLLKSFNILKWKAPGKFTLPDRSTTEWKFKLSYTGIDLTITDNIQQNQAITMYSRKNVI